MRACHFERTMNQSPGFKTPLANSWRRKKIPSCSYSALTGSIVVTAYLQVDKRHYSDQLSVCTNQHQLMLHTKMLACPHPLCRSHNFYHDIWMGIRTDFLHQQFLSWNQLWFYLFHYWNNCCHWLGNLYMWWSCSPPPNQVSIFLCLCTVVII